MNFLYSHTDPATIIKAYIRSLPEGQRRGPLNRIAKAAGIFPSYLSQILKGDRYLSLDQAMQVARFMSLSDHETKYFLRATELVRAQSKTLRDQILAEMNEIKFQHQQLRNYVDHEELQLSDADQARFYSSWVYPTVRLLIAIPSYRTPGQIAKKLGITEKDTRSIIEFLVRTGLCVETNQGVDVGPVHTHLDEKSPHVTSHHANWRRRAMDRHPLQNPVREISYSGVLTLSPDEVFKIRSMVLQFVKDVRQVSDPSPARELFALNIDWFEV